MLLTYELQRQIKNVVKGEVRFNEPMRDRTTIKIGGPADVWFEPIDIEDIVAVTKFASENEIDITVFGGGSNILVRDKGVRGLVMSLAKFNEIKVSENSESIITAGAGVKLQQLLEFTLEKKLTGLECVTGIPGTVGGAVTMNAGTTDESVGLVVSNVKWVNKGKIYDVGKEKLDFSYRKLKAPKSVVIVEATFALETAERESIEAKINKIRKHRRDTQPLQWPSLGSVFKNPDKKEKAWELIDGCRLRGVRVGGARVSNEHANWIINEGNATAHDVEVLIRTIKEKVKEESDILLEPEITMIGE